MTVYSRRNLFGLGAAGLALASLPQVAQGAAPRFVTTELILTETALALGLTPIAAGNLPLYRRLVGSPDLPAGLSDLGPLNEPNMELLVHLAPDLILAADWQRGPQAALERIAPVLWLETLPFLRPPLGIAAALAAEIARAGGTDPALLISALQTAVTALRENVASLQPPPLILARFLDDGRHALVFTEGSMPGDLLALAGAANALASPGRPGAMTLGIGEILAHGAPVLSLGPLPESPLFRRVSDGGGLRATALPAIFPAGGIASACRLCEALSAGLEQL